MHCGSPRHTDMYMALSLLKIAAVSGPIYFIVEGSACLDNEVDLNHHRQFFYEEHTCPINILGNGREAVKNIVMPDSSRRGGADFDPHGVFTHVRSVWLLKEWADLEEPEWEDKMLEIFPEVTAQ